MILQHRTARQGANTALTARDTENTLINKTIADAPVFPCLGETVLPQAQCSVGPAGSVRWHPEAVELCWTDQGPGATEAAQPALPHEGPTQRPRVQVTKVQTCDILATINHAASQTLYHQ